MNCVNPECRVPVTARPSPVAPGTRRLLGLGLCSRCYHRTRRPCRRVIPDEFVIDCVLTGTAMTTNTPERRVLVPELFRRGMTAREIAARLRVDARTVHRLRRQLQSTETP